MGWVAEQRSALSDGNIAEGCGLFAHACVWYGEGAGVVVDKHVGRWQAVREEERVQEEMDLRERLGAVDLAWPEGM